MIPMKGIDQKSSATAGFTIVGAMVSLLVVVGALMAFHHLSRIAMESVHGGIAQQEAELVIQRIGADWERGIAVGDGGGGFSSGIVYSVRVTEETVHANAKRLIVRVYWETNRPLPSDLSQARYHTEGLFVVPTSSD